MALAFKLKNEVTKSLWSVTYRPILYVRSIVTTFMLHSRGGSTWFASCWCYELTWSGSGAILLPANLFRLVENRDVAKTPTIETVASRRRSEVCLVGVLLVSFDFWQPIGLFHKVGPYCSVVTRFRHGETFNDRFIANLQLNVEVKRFKNRSIISQDMDKSLCVLLWVIV